MASHHPAEISRRGFLRTSCLTLGGLTLADMSPARAATQKAIADAVPKDTSVILFWMWGGPSHLETYDCKPDAPREIRGEFRPIKTNVPGIDICELFPRQAKLADKFTLIRSVHHTLPNHNDGAITMLTGSEPATPDPLSTKLGEFPDFGMITAWARRQQRNAIPPYVGIPQRPVFCNPAYVGRGFDGLAAGDPSEASYSPQSFKLRPELNTERMNGRRTLVGDLDRLRREIDSQGDMKAVDDFRHQAFDLLLSTKTADAFAIDRESPSLRDRYGRHIWGQSCLLARRLVEAGVSVVTIDAGNPAPNKTPYFSWDDHAMNNWGIFDAMRFRLPFMDQAVSALIEDVHARGLNRRVMIVAMGEFGRTPVIAPFFKGGRDHWPSAQSVLISGGGARMGQVIGATNAKGEYPVERALKPNDLMATIYRHLGVNPHASLVDKSGRPVSILHEGTPITELV